MRKRRSLVGVVVVFFLMVSVVSSVQAVDWQQFKGTTLTLMSWKHPWTTAMKPLLPEFEKKTGIKVNLVEYPEDQHRQKVAVLLAGGSSDLDVFMTGVRGGEGEIFGPNGWYQPILPYMLDMDRTEQEYTNIFDDISLGLWNLCMAPGPDGNMNIWSIQLMFEPWIYVYRKDLFDEYGLSVPVTMSEMEMNAEKIYEASNKEVFGAVMRGKGAAATSAFSVALYAMGGAWEDEQGNPTINTPEAIEAFDWWGRILRLYGPPGVVNYHWYEVQSALLQGQAAQAIQASGAAKFYDDPEQSAVVGRMFFASTPAGPQGQSGAWGGGHQLAISALSEKKDAAWLLVQFLTNKDAYVQYLNAGIGSPRGSVWDDPRVKVPYTKSLMKAYQDEIKRSIGYPGASPGSIKNAAEARDVIGQAIVASILGQDVKAAVDNAQVELEKMLERQKAE